jgi:hypothetical protein
LVATVLRCVEELALLIVSESTSPALVCTIDSKASDRIISDRQSPFDLRDLIKVMNRDGNA